MEESEAEWPWNPCFTFKTTTALTQSPAPFGLQWRPYQTFVIEGVRGAYLIDFSTKKTLVAVGPTYANK